MTGAILLAKPAKCELEMSGFSCTQFVSFWVNFVAIKMNSDFQLVRINTWCDTCTAAVCRLFYGSGLSLNTAISSQSNFNLLARYKLFTRWMYLLVNLTTHNLKHGLTPKCRIMPNKTHKIQSLHVSLLQDFDAKGERMLTTS